MTTNSSGKLNMGGVSAIKDIVQNTSGEFAAYEVYRLSACLRALAHQPKRWDKYQDWGEGGPISYLADRGIIFTRIDKPVPVQRSWYDGCECKNPHWEYAKLDQSA